MASIYNSATLLLLLCFFFFLHQTVTPTAAELVKEQPLTLKYHNGVLLKGKISVNLIWYGKFTPAQRSIIVDFFQSLSTPASHTPSASSWWQTTEKYKGGAANLILGKQLLHEDYPFGKSLKNSHISVLGRSRSPAATGQDGLTSINVVLTAQDVAVEGFCMRCGSHGSVRPTAARKSSAGSRKTAYIWVGNSVVQCPGQCAWPFKQSMYGPQTPPLLPPSGDVGVDGMIINLATLLAGTVTNPFSDGYFQGPANAPLEAVSACTGKFGSGAYPGYPGQLLVDKTSGASFNAYGVNGRKFLVPAMWDPATSACSTLV